MSCLKLLYKTDSVFNVPAGWCLIDLYVTTIIFKHVCVFPSFLSDGGSSSMRGDSELMMVMGVRSANQSPQSVGSSGVDSGVDSLSDQVGDLPHVAISLCGGLTDNSEITRGGEKECTKNKVQVLLCPRDQWRPSTCESSCLHMHCVCVYLTSQSSSRKGQFPSRSSLKILL